MSESSRIDVDIEGELAKLAGAGFRLLRDGITDGTIPQTDR